jgi:GTP-binding protein
MTGNIKFIKSVFDIKELPKSSLREVVLCGRSNVGKSSLINSLFNRKNIAKTSSTPGKTRSINYYEVDERFYLVDLPGFGYAKTSKKEREFWAALIESYLSESKNISLVFHLIDSRHKPTDLDLKLNELIKYYRLEYNIILTKIDKLNQSELSRTKDGIKKAFADMTFGQNLFVYSSIKKTGKKQLLQRLAKLN